MNSRLKILVTISLLVNLLLAGLFIGNVGRCFLGPHRYSWHEITMALPLDEQQSFEATMKQAEADTGALRKQLGDAHRKAADMLKAEPFHKDEYIAQMQKVHELHGKIMQRMVSTVAGLAEQLSPEDRATLAEMLRHPPRPPSDD